MKPSLDYRLLLQDVELMYTFLFTKLNTFLESTFIEYLENITHSKYNTKSIYFLCLFFFLVNEEEHPHVVCQRRRRRPCSSASQGGLILTTSWCEGAFVTAGKFLTLRGVGRAVMAGWQGLGSNILSPLRSDWFVNTVLSSLEGQILHKFSTSSCGAAKTLNEFSLERTVSLSCGRGGPVVLFIFGQSFF